MILIGIDGGCGNTAAVKIEYTPGELPVVLDKVYLPNKEMLDWLWLQHADLIAIEAIMSNGGAGAEVIQTAYWNGRFSTTIQCSGKAVCLFERNEIKRLLFGKAIGNDSKVTQHIEDMYGGRQKARGTKKKPGPLYGITKHLWQALGCAFACIQALESDKPEEHYWDELYTERDSFRQKKVARREQRAQSTKRKSEKGRQGGRLADAMKERLNK
jgi:Holliday junction resolvasome RuvABC endonuclease subunit